MSETNTPAGAADLAAAQRELDAACEEAGATIGCMRATGDVSAAALRAIARTIRETHSQIGENDVEPR